ncbi:MAG: type II toxin-antitoxin system RelE/ParE family toxin [Dehalococcoidales bacterium]|nr:type II toxin-antitoxin system RelE/ParE family toxin [Dehalococcoidales bacterium]
MTYQVRFTPGAIQDLSRLDKTVAQRILSKIKWLSENFDDLTPERLSGNLRGLLKLRIGSYRVIYTLIHTVSPATNESERVITIHLVGHRREIYKEK